MAAADPLRLVTTRAPFRSDHDLSEVAAQQKLVIRLNFLVCTRCRVFNVSTMKKIIVRGLIVLVILVVVAVVVIGLSLGSIVKKGVETVGPQIAKVDIKLDSVSLSLLSGSGTIKGLLVGNPEGYKSPQAITVGLAGVSVSPGSVLSDKVVVRSVRVESPEITFEGNPMNNNLSKILDNVNAATGGGGQTSPQPEAKAGKKLQVDDFVITGAKVHVGAGGPVVSIPDIHLTNLGTGPEGITAADLTQRVLSEVVKHTLTAVAGAATELGKGALDMGKEAGNQAITGGVERIQKSVGDLFKKKQPD